jgi:hypothetical protein
VHESLARRAARIVSAVALIALALTVAPPASAQSLFQGALDPPLPAPSPSPFPISLPTPEPSPVPSLSASQLALPHPGLTLTPAPLLRPDVKVVSLGVIHLAGGSGAYAFRVTNVGQGSATAVKTTRQAVVRRKSDKTWVRTEVHTSNDGPLKPGQDLTVDVPCPANQRQYCDVGGVLAEVVGSPEDADPSNNHAPTFEDIRGT